MLGSQGSSTRGGRDRLRGVVVNLEQLQKGVGDGERRNDEQVRTIASRGGGDKESGW